MKLSAHNHLPQRVTQLHDLRADGRPAVLAIGIFDGVHLGHQAIFHALNAMAERLGAVPAALFFQPRPRVVLQQGARAELLCEPLDNLRLMGEAGVQMAVQMPFTRDLAALSAQMFYDTYLQPEAAIIRGYCVGENWRFGSDGRTGDTLRRLAAHDGADVCVVPSVCHDGATVSSTRIREAVRAGDVVAARALMGHPFRLCGTVQHGKGAGGSVLSYPTANVSFGEQVIPRFGVYAVRGYIETPMGAETHDGIAYVGDAPTLGGNAVVLEWHVFDFDGDLYGHNVAIEFIQYLRPSQLFSDAEALHAQIVRDIDEARAILQKEH